MKKFFAIVMSMLMIACFMPSMAFAEQSAENDATSIDLDTFIKWLQESHYTVDGSTYSNTNAVQDGKLNVKWSPVSGCFDDRDDHTCTVKKAVPTGNTPNRVNDNYAQYQLFKGLSSNVTIKNVNFEYTPGIFKICANTDWTKEGAETIPAELQFENVGDTTLIGCTFDKTGVSVMDANESHKTIIKDCTFRNVNKNCFNAAEYGDYAIHGLRNGKIYVSGNTFENVCRAMLIYSSNNTETYIVNNDFSGVADNEAMIKVDGTKTDAKLVVFGNTDTGNRGTVCRMVENIQIHTGVDDNITYTTNSNYRGNETADIGSVSVASDGVATSTVLTVAKIVKNNAATEYETLAAAIANATSGDTITLLNDVAVSSALSVNKNVTIDGQGKYTIKAASDFSAKSGKENNCVLYITSDVTLKDVSVDGNDKCRVICCTSGKLTIDGATVTKGKTASSYIGGVYMTGKSSFEMKSGSIAQNSNAKDYQSNYLQYSKDLWIGSEATGIISGGTVGNAFVNANKYSKNEAGLTLTGGKIGNVYVEYDDSQKAQFIYTDGVVEKLYLAKDNKGNSIGVAPEKGNTYNGGISEDQVATVTLKYADSSTSGEVLTVPKNSLVNLPAPTLSGYTFNGWYSEGTKIASPYTVTEDATLAASWSRIRSGSSSSSSTTTTTDTVTNKTEDKTTETGSTTETNEVATTTATVKTETKTAADGTKTVAATVDTTTASKIVEKAVENKSEEVVIDAAAAATTGTTAVTETAAGTTTKVDLPEQTVKAIAEKTEAAVTIKSEAAEIKLDTEAVKAVAEQAGDTGTVNLVVETVAQNETKVEVDLKLVTSKGTVSDFKGGSVSVTIKLNTALAAKPVVCVYIDDFGTYHKVKGVKNADGTFTFETGHFSTYAVMEEGEADGVIAEQTKNVKKKVNGLSLKARSAKTAKGNIKVTLTVDADDIKAIEELGYTVKYKFYRSTEKSASYKAALEKADKTYTNTTGKKGTKYYYKARVMIYDAQGELVTKTELKQCRYACRTK